MEISIQIKEEKLSWRETDKSKEIENLSIKHRILKFQNDYINYFSGKKNTLEFQTTEGYFYVLHLHKKRLRILGIKIEPEFLMPWGGKSNYFIHYLTDQRYLIAVAKESVWLKKTYIQDGILLYEGYYEDTARYSVVRQKRDICPCCGKKNIPIKEYNESTCSYCNAPIYPKDLDQKIAAFGIQYTEQTARQACDEMMDWLAKIVAIAVGTIGFVRELFMIFQNHGSGFIILFSILTFGLWSCIAFVSVLLLKNLFRYTNKLQHYFKYHFLKKESPKLPQELEKEMRKWDSSFSVELFLGYLENILQTIHFAQSPKEYELFLFHQIEIPRIYQNIIDCFVKKTEFKNIYISENCYTIQTEVQMELFMLEQEKVKKKRERLQITMSCNKECKQTGQLHLGAYCPSCGTKFQMKWGKKCSECGKIYPVSEAGWLLTDYQIL